MRLILHKRHTDRWTTGSPDHRTIGPPDHRTTHQPTEPDHWTTRPPAAGAGGPFLRIPKASPPKSVFFPASSFIIQPNHVYLASHESRLARSRPGRTQKYAVGAGNPSELTIFEPPLCLHGVFRQESLVWVPRKQRSRVKLVRYSDTDWTGCPLTRRSTSATVVTFGSTRG